MKNNFPNPVSRRACPVSSKTSAACRLLCAVALVFIFNLSAFGATVTGTILDVNFQPYSGANNSITFTPLSCPQAVNVVSNGVTNAVTVWDVARSAKMTNGAFRVNLAGGIYFAGLASPQPFGGSGRTVKILVPPNDTNTYQFNYCANLATNLGTFVWTNTPQGIKVYTTNSASVTFSGDGTSTNPLTATAAGGGSGFSGIVTNFAGTAAAITTNQSIAGTTNLIGVLVTNLDSNFNGYYLRTNQYDFNGTGVSSGQDYAYLKFSEPTAVLQQGPSPSRYWAINTNSFYFGCINFNFNSLNQYVGYNSGTTPVEDYPNVTVTNFWKPNNNRSAPAIQFSVIPVFDTLVTNYSYTTNTVTNFNLMTFTNGLCFTNRIVTQ